MDPFGDVDEGGPGCTFTCPSPPAPPPPIPPPPPDGTGGAYECDLLEQDCPEDEKCMPWSNNGGPIWTATRCSPIWPDAKLVGEACTVDGNDVSGLDDCEIGLVCVDVDPATSTGTCSSLCVGSPDALSCEDPNEDCIVVNGPTPLCVTLCDPVDPVCDNPQGCFLFDGHFACRTPTIAGEAGDPCASTTGCGAGLMCAYGPAFECEAEPGQGCCAAVCDATAFDSCAVGECIPWFPDPAPEGTEHVGVCGTA